MNRPIAHGGGLLVPRPSRVIITLIAVNVALYVLELILLRTGVGWFVETLFLTPRDVYQRGFVWQLFTYGWFHSPGAVGHLLMNMLFLWLFGAQMEEWWGRKRFLKAYAIFIVSGGLLTLVASLLVEASALTFILSPDFPTVPHLGASGGVLGITVAWGLTFAHREMNFLLLGRMKGSTFVLLIVGIEILVALSFSNTSSTAHFGGIIGAFVLCRGLWRPARWKEIGRRLWLQRKKASIERELGKMKGGKKKPPPGWRVVEGGDGDDPKKWN